MADIIPLSQFVSIIVPGTADKKLSIKKFVESQKISFKVGNGFYQLSKPEIIQLSKTILVQRLSSPNELVTGSKTIRQILKIDEDAKKNGRFMVDFEILKEFKIFVQSTSYNRNLIGGTTFLYRKEADVSAPTSTVATVATPVVIVTSATDDPDGPLPPKRARGRPRAGAPTPAAVNPVITTKGPIGGGPGAGAISDKVEIVISFDTTGSMYPCLSTVRSVVRDTLTKLTTGIPSVRIGILAHGDYCDRNSSYVIKAANDYKLCGAEEVSKLVDFVTNVSSTGGGDTPECYELVLQEVATKFDWSPSANKSLILIGDAPPHGPNDNPTRIDWRAEAIGLKDKGIRIYAVQALDYKQAEYFYREIAQITLGFHLRLYQFSSITDFLLAVFYREGDASGDSQNLNDFEAELTSSGRMVNNLRNLFDQLQGRTASVSSGSTAAISSSGSSGLVPVSPSRFQVLIVNQSQAIKQFAQARGLIFKPGCGFYEFTKPETISDKKEVVLMEKTTEDFYTGWKAARELSGIEPGKAIKQKPKESDKYIIFVQSTSYNRKLIAGQRFLYEVDADC